MGHCLVRWGAGADGKVIHSGEVTVLCAWGRESSPQKSETGTSHCPVCVGSRPAGNIDNA